MLFYFLATLCAVLSGMGVGSAGILVVLLSIMQDTEHMSAQGINLVFFMVSSVSALAINIKKRCFYPKIFLIMGIGGLVGSLLGAFLALNTDPLLVRKIFGGMLIFTGLFCLSTLVSDFIKKHCKGKYLKKHFTN